MTWVRRSFVAVAGIAAGYLIQGYGFKDQEFNRPLFLAAWVALVGGLAVWVLLGEPVLNVLRHGPELATGKVSEHTRNAIGGADLQVVTVSVYNRRDSGGERATARDVYPKLEALDADGKVFASTGGNWVEDYTGKHPTTVTFRPTHQEHGLEIAGKFPNGERAWLAGEHDPGSLTPGEYVIRATLRGDNLRRPAVFEFDLSHAGGGSRLVVSPRPRGWRDRVARWSRKRREKRRADPHESPPVASPHPVGEPPALPRQVPPQPADASDDVPPDEEEYADEGDEDDEPHSSPANAVVMKDRVELRLAVGAGFLVPSSPATCEVTAPSGTTYRTEVVPSRPTGGVLGALYAITPRVAVVQYPMGFPNAPMRLSPGVYQVRWEAPLPLGLSSRVVFDNFRVGV